MRKYLSLPFAIFIISIVIPIIMKIMRYFILAQNMFELPLSISIIISFIGSLIAFVFNVSNQLGKVMISGIVTIVLSAFCYIFITYWEEIVLIIELLVACFGIFLFVNTDPLARKIFNIKTSVYLELN